MFKLGDFGLAKQPESGGTQTLIGTDDYMAPEMSDNDRPYDSKVDMWALGVLYYKILFGTSPYQGQHQAGQYRFHLTK